jgi:hypothetical protein
MPPRTTSHRQETGDMRSAFGVEHGEVSKLFERQKARKLSDLKGFKQAGAKEKNIRWVGKKPKGYGT